MKPRRSRISRIYRHLTRRQPNRRSQWQQISLSRPHGAPGHPLPICRQWAYALEEPRAAALPEGGLSIDLETFAPFGDDRQSTGGAVIAGLATSLFLLGCAYAAFAGYVLSIKSSFAYVGIVGSVVSLLAAGIGICLAASSVYRRHSGTLLSVSVISMGALYGVLLCATLSR